MPRMEANLGELAQFPVGVRYRSNRSSGAATQTAPLQDLRRPCMCGELQVLKPDTSRRYPAME